MYVYIFFTPTRLLELIVYFVLHIFLYHKRISLMMAKTFACSFVCFFVIFLFVLINAIVWLCIFFPFFSFRRCPMYLKVYFLFFSSHACRKERTSHYSSISFDLEPNEKEEKKHQCARICSPISFNYLYWIFANVLRRWFSFSSAALVRAQLIHRRARAHSYFFISSRFFLRER